MDIETVIIEGQTYKIGFRNKVYSLCGDEWRLSLNRSPDEVVQAIKNGNVRKRRRPAN